MTAKRVLIIGGNGIISWWVTQRAIDEGYVVTQLTRGLSADRSPIDQVTTLHGDADDPATIRSAVGRDDYDIVVNFRAFRPEQVAADIELFSGRVGQYIFVSSASAYQKPIAALPIVESTPLRNPFWQYSRDKIACEDLLVAAYRESAFPMTIVRPSHTYDGGNMPFPGGWTAFQRMLDGKPVVVHGDGTSWWTLTHSRDFARAFVGLFGNPHALGAPVHITSDEHLTWDDIARQLGRAIGAEPTLVHVASERIARELPDLGPWLLGDWSHSVAFDNTRIKSLVPGWTATTPFSQGVHDIADWYLSTPSRKVVDPVIDAAWDRLAAL